MHGALRGNHGIWRQTHSKVIRDAPQKAPPVVAQQLLKLTCRMESREPVTCPDWSRGHVTAGADVAACCRVASLAAASSQWDGRRGNTKLLTLRPSAKAQPLSIRCPYLSVLRHTQPFYLFYSYYFHFALDSLCSCCCSNTVYLLGEPAQDWCFRHKWQIKTWKNPLLKPGQGPDLSPAPLVAARTLTLDPDP